MIVELTDETVCSPSAALVPLIGKSSCCLLCSLMTGNDVTGMSSQMQTTACGGHMVPS